MGAEPAQAPTPARDPAPQGGANGTDDGLAEVGAALAARRPITQGEFDTYVRTLREQMVGEGPSEGERAAGLAARLRAEARGQSMSEVKAPEAPGAAAGVGATEALAAQAAAAAVAATPAAATAAERQQPESVYELGLRTASRLAAARAAVSSLPYSPYAGRRRQRHSIGAPLLAGQPRQRLASYSASAGPRPTRGPRLRCRPRSAAGNPRSRLRSAGCHRTPSARCSTTASSTRACTARWTRARRTSSSCRC